MSLAACSASGARRSRPTSMPEFEPLGLLNDDDNPVGAVHLGLVYAADAGGRPVADPRDATSSRAASCTWAEVAAVADKLETWSALLFDFLATSRPIIVTNNMNTFARRSHLLKRLARLAFAAGLALLLVGTHARRGQCAPRSTCCRPAASSTRSWPATCTTASPRPQRDGAAAALIELNTPGGDLTATRDIVTDAAQRAAAGDRVGRPGGRPRGQRGHVHHARRARRDRWRRHEHRRRHAHRQQRRGHRRRPWATRSSRTREALLRSHLRRARPQLRLCALTTVTEAKAYTADEAVAAGSVDGIAPHTGGGRRLRQRPDRDRQRPAGRRSTLDDAPAASTCR